MVPIKASTPPAARPSIESLKKRADFLRVRGGARFSVGAFVLEAKPRDQVESSRAGDRPRFGFTVTKRLGKAVERNRIKRRLRAAVREVQVHHAKPGFDYVVIARSSAFDAVFAELVGDLTRALERVHKAPHGRRGQRGRNENN